MTTTTQPQPPASDMLEPAMHTLSEAISAITSIRWMLHAHSVRPSLVSDSQYTEALLHHRDEVLRHTDAAIRGYAEAVDPTGVELACVRDALAEPVQAECKPFTARLNMHDVGHALDWPAIGVYVTEA